MRGWGYSSYCRREATLAAENNILFSKPKPVPCEVKPKVITAPLGLSGEDIERIIEKEANKHE